MMTAYNAMLSVDRRGSRLLVTDAFGHDLVKARLPLYSEHPRALLTLLEGLALYAGAAYLSLTMARIWSPARRRRAFPWCLDRPQFMQATWSFTGSCLT
jgi:hypothetical protein